MTLTSIANESGETIVGTLNEKSNDKIILIVHGEQGELLMDVFWEGGREGV